MISSLSDRLRLIRREAIPLLLIACSLFLLLALSFILDILLVNWPSLMHDTMGGAPLPSLTQWVVDNISGYRACHTTSLSFSGSSWSLPLLPLVCLRMTAHGPELSSSTCFCSYGPWRWRSSSLYWWHLPCRSTCCWDAWIPMRSASTLRSDSFPLLSSSRSLHCPRASSTEGD